jgi:hypothetical protein
MSDTPISDSTPHNVAELGMLCRRIERELTAANSKIELLMSANADVARIAGERDAAEQRIKRLEEALDLVVLHCSWVHHSKKHQHKYGEPCPVVALIEKVKEAKL